MLLWAPIHWSLSLLPLTAFFLELRGHESVLPQPTVLTPEGIIIHGPLDGYYGDSISSATTTETTISVAPGSLIGKLWYSSEPILPLAWLLIRCCSASCDGITIDNARDCYFHPVHNAAQWSKSVRVVILLYFFIVEHSSQETIFCDGSNWFFWGSLSIRRLKVSEPKPPNALWEYDADLLSRRYCQSMAIKWRKSFKNVLGAVSKPKGKGHKLKTVIYICIGN